MYRIYRIYEGRYKAYITSSKYLLIKEEEKHLHAGVFTLEKAQAWIKKNQDYDWKLEEI